ncbi:MULTISPECIES: hypothetical protein [unclassified Streptomyces]|uniref:hypothetical protein n=1 Tax=unclassified Streptomyces TaxID=2593676 RepID=UPI000DD72C01|nr:MULTISPECIES: hypothetical protein [unclassified Streptomyces]QZZ26535.1 hypothetical protein A7X85_09955 [Streptomyces sp. ST1015]
MSTTADSTRYLKTVWRGEKPWERKALYVGHVQPRGYRTYWRSRWLWQLHLTPVHLHRDCGRWEIGVCFGKRTFFLKSHS